MMSHKNGLKPCTALALCLGVAFAFGLTLPAHALTYSETQKLKSCQVALDHASEGDKFSDIGVDRLLDAACQTVTRSGKVVGSSDGSKIGSNRKVTMPKYTTLDRFPADVKEEMAYNIEQFRQMSDPINAYQKWKEYMKEHMEKEGMSSFCKNGADIVINEIGKELLETVPAKCLQSEPSRNGYPKVGDPDGNFYRKLFDGGEWVKINKEDTVSADTRPDLTDETKFMDYCKTFFAMGYSPTQRDAKCNGLYPQFSSGEIMFELKKFNTTVVNQFRPEVFKKYFPNVPNMAGPASSLPSRCVKWGHGKPGNEYQNDPEYMERRAHEDAVFRDEQRQYNEASAVAASNGPEVVVTKIEDLYNHPAYAKMDAETKAAITSSVTYALAQRESGMGPTAISNTSLNPTTKACPKESCYSFIVYRKGNSPDEVKAQDEANKAAKAKELARAMNIPERLIGGFTSVGQLLVNISNLGNDLDGVVGGDGIYNTLKQCASVSSSGSVCTLTDSKYQFSYKVP